MNYLLMTNIIMAYVIIIKNVFRCTLGFITFLFLFLLVVGCSLPSVTNEHPPPEKPSTVDYFANNATGNSLALIQHPAGVHVNNTTYVSYQGPQSHPYVVAYDHTNGIWQGPYKAGNSDLAEVFIDKNKINSHGKPTMLIDDLGYIHIFYGGHGAGNQYGPNPYGGGGLGRNKHAVSMRPYDITEWQDLNNISVFGTYNQAIKMDNGDIYLIYRHGAHRSDWTYQKSTDHGRSFSPAVPFLKHKDRKDIDAFDSWYVWASKGEGNDIIMSFDYHVCWDKGKGPEGLGHITQRHDLYYMVFDTQTETLRNIHNSPLAFPVTKEIADDNALVARTGEDWTFNGSAHLDQHGFAHIGINIGKNLGQNTGGPKQTAHYHWDGTKWQGGQPVRLQSKIDNTNTRGDFEIVEQTGHIQYFLAYQDQQDGVIAKYTSVDNGMSFNKTKELLRREYASWAISARIENAHPDAQVIVAEKQATSPWRKVYLIGDNGPIRRDKTGAESQE